MGLLGLGKWRVVGVLFAWNFSATRSTVFKEAERRTRPNMTPH